MPLVGKLHAPTPSHVAPDISHPVTGITRPVMQVGDAPAMLHQGVLTAQPVAEGPQDHAVSAAEAVVPPHLREGIRLAHSQPEATHAACGPDEPDDALDEFLVNEFFE